MGNPEPDPLDSVELKLPWMRAFLEALRAQGWPTRIGEAAGAAGVARSTAYEAKERPTHKAFSDAWDTIVFSTRSDAMELARAVAFQRAAIGWKWEEVAEVDEEEGIVGPELLAGGSSPLKKTRRTKRVARGTQVDNRLLARLLEAYDPDWGRSRSGGSGSAPDPGAVAEAIRKALADSAPTVPERMDGHLAGKLLDPRRATLERRASAPPRKLCVECGVEVPAGLARCPDSECPSNAPAGPGAGSGL